jgi:uncharacterized protein (DUF2267 family)
MTTGLAVFDTTLQETNLWLKEVESHLGESERQEAYAALRAVLHALRDRLPAHSAVSFAAQLPMLLRGVYFEGWTLPDKPERSHSVQEFADGVRASLHPRFRFDPVMVSRAVFAVVAKFMSQGETEKIMAQLPAQLRELWPARGTA